MDAHMLWIHLMKHVSQSQLFIALALSNVLNLKEPSNNYQQLINGQLQRTYLMLIKRKRNRKIITSYKFREIKRIFVICICNRMGPRAIKD